MAQASQRPKRPPQGPAAQASSDQARPRPQRSNGTVQARAARTGTQASTRRMASRWRSSLISLAVTAVVVLGLVAVVHAVTSSRSSGGSTPAAASGSSGASSSAGGVPASAAVPGKLAPAFTLPTLSGAPFSLASAHGHPVVLYFMATNCSTCVAGSQGLAQAVQAAHVAGAQAVAIDVNAGDSSAALSSFEQAVGVPANAPVIWGVDLHDSITQAYGVQTLETTVVINGQGRIAYYSPASVAPQQLAQIIQKAA